MTIAVVIEGTDLLGEKHTIVRKITSGHNPCECEILLIILRAKLDKDFKEPRHNYRQTHPSQHSPAVKNDQAKWGAIG
jgi:hypothetical protein